MACSSVGAIRAAGRVAATLAAATLAAATLLAGCASRTPAPPPGPRSLLSIEAGRPVALDQHRVSLPFALSAGNPGAEPIGLESVECILSVGGRTYRTRFAGRPAGLPARLPPGESVGLTVEFLVDTRELDAGLTADGGPAEAAWRMDAAAALEGGPRLAASAEGLFPIVREPRLVLRSVRIERDLLVTTNLRLALDLVNPNAFPVELGALAYDFHGEGRLWAQDSSPGPVLVPARGLATLGPSLEMNFADMDRRLFDLVANLRVVRYRLAGTATVATGRTFLPEFLIRFDLEGSCPVER